MDSLCIDLGIMKVKGDTQKCSHFSIRGYVSKIIERDGSNFLPFSDGIGEEMPPMEVPRFRYWRCQSCLQDCGAPASTSQETALVFHNGQIVHLSGLKPVDEKNNNERVLAVLEVGESQLSPQIHADEPAKSSAVDTNATAPGIKESYDLEDCEDPDQEDDDSSGLQSRKARKVRLLTELLSGSTEHEQRKKQRNPLDLGSRGTSSFQHKRKTPEDQDRRDVDDVSNRGKVGKKLKTFKGDAAAKTSMVKHTSGDQGTSKGGANVDKHQRKKHATQRSSVLDDRVCSDLVTAWWSTLSDTKRAAKSVAAADVGSRPSYNFSKGRGTESYSNIMPPPQPDEKSNAFKKVSKNLLREDLQRAATVGGARVKDLQSDMKASKLGLSLNYDPQAQISSLPSELNQAPSQDQSRKTGFFVGESSIACRVPSDPKSNERYVPKMSDGHTPRSEFHQEERHYAQFLHGSFSQHHKLDFSDPLNKRTGGIGGYPDVMRAPNHQRQEKMFSIGRSDEREIAELMAKIQHERSLYEGRSYCVPGGSNNLGIPNLSGFVKDNWNGRVPVPHQEYPSMWKSSSPVSTSQNVGPTTVKNPAPFSHQERVPAFTMFDASSQYQKQQSNGIWVSDSGPWRQHNPHYCHNPKGNNKTGHQSSLTHMHVKEVFNQNQNGIQQNEAARDVNRSTVAMSMSFGQPCLDKSKGKSVIDLDLNLDASNFESLNRTSTEYHPSYTKEKTLVHNPKHMGLDYNEAIPAMQLLSLMDSGKSSFAFNMKPFSPCYNHSSSMTGKENSMENSHISHSRLGPGLQQPTESSRHFLSAAGSSPSFGVPNSFSSMFRTNQNENGCQVYHKPRQEKARGSSSACRPEDSFVFPLSWHATEDHSRLVNMGAKGKFGSRNGSSRTELCTVNRNPADFSTPGPENVYMINVGHKKQTREMIFKQPRLQW